MIELIALAAVGQLQTVNLPPVSPPPPSPVIVNAVPPPPAEVTGFPDLVISSIRVVDGDPSFEVKNQGHAATTRPARVTSCGYFEKDDPDKRICSRDAVVGTLAPGQSRWVAVTCFPIPGAPVSSGGGLFGGVRITEAGPSQCWPARSLGLAWKFSARVDGSSNDPTFTGERTAPAAVQDECDYSFGCIRETDESNNRSEYEAPFPN